MMFDNPSDDGVAAKEGSPRRAPKRWHAVVVTAPKSACAAAKACKDKRFLSADAPMLPLKGCDSARCECKYRHHDDRRAAPRRREEAIGTSGARVDSERREKGGRRATD